MKVNFENLNLTIGEEKVERIGTDCKKKFFKFVGHHLDEFLTWEHQINHVQGKLASANYAISCSKNFLPKQIRLTLYNSLFRSHLDFGILSWGCAPESKLKKIITLQKKCLRNVACKSYRSHTDPIFSSLKVLKFNDLFKSNCSVFMHKIFNNKQPESFQGMFPVLPGTDIGSRTNNFQLDKLKNSGMSHFPAATLPRIWNALKPEIKHIESRNSFQNQLVKSIIDTYPSTVHCHDDYCPDCN